MLMIIKKYVYITNNNFNIHSFKLFLLKNTKNKLL